MGIEKAKTSPSREKLVLLWESVKSIVSDPEADESQLTEDHENRIRRHYNQLLSNLSVPDVVTQMFQSGKLTTKGHEHIRKFYSTPIRASEELLNIVIRNSRDVFECFLESLKKTKQHHVYQVLTCDDENVYTGEQSVSEHSRLLRQNYDWLTESLDPDNGLTTILFAKEILSCREYEQTVSEKNRFVKNEILLSIISRKSVGDFNKFMYALRENSQEGIVKRLTDKKAGVANENCSKTTIIRTLSTRLAGSSKEKVPPKTPPKPRKPLPASSINNQLIVRCKSLLPPTSRAPTPNRLEKEQNSSEKETAGGNLIFEKKRSVEALERNFKKLQNKLQTEVSIKIVQVRERTSTDSIWKTCFEKILEELENIKRQSIIQTKVADEKCDSLMQEILNRDSECKKFKDCIQQEKNKTQKQLRQLQETVYELEEKLNLTQNQKRTLWEVYKISEEKVKSLQILIEQKEKEVNEKVSIIEKLKDHASHSEQAIEEPQVQLRKTEVKSKESEPALKRITANVIDDKITSIEPKDDPQDKCKFELVLLKTITAKATEDKETILGLTILDKELFVVSHLSSEVAVYDSKKFCFSRRWKLKELFRPIDIGSSNRNKCLYILDYKGPYAQSKEILRVDANGKLIHKWSTGGAFGYGLSITDESNVILTACFENKLNEYSPDGQLIREIKLSSDSGILYPWHAIKLTNGHFLLSHGFNGYDLHRVCEVDADGKLQKSFGGKCGSSIGQMFNPFYLAVDRNGFVIVADRENSRVLLLDSDLKFKREILCEEKNKLRDPHRILLDQVNDRLFVADNETDSRRMYRNGRILIFDCSTIQTSFNYKL